MRLERLGRVAVVGMMLILAVGCSDGATEPGTEETVLLSLVPQGGATGVDPNAPVVIRFSHPMMQGMEDYADVHESAVEGPLVLGAWSWSADITALTFTPDAPLKAQTQYVIHIGGGMEDQEGHHVNIEAHGIGMGGQWMTQRMYQGGQHGYGMGQGGGMGGGGMGAGWTHPSNGSYGMVFIFTTA